MLSLNIVFEIEKLKARTKKARETISRDRTRKNLLRESEQTTIAFLVERVPKWISSDMLTWIGFGGNFIVLISFVLAAHFNNYFLSLGVVGLVINWIGDSLDGRLAYYRNKPRKWYGFALDITVDWLGVILIGLGYLYYAEGYWKFVGYLFIVFYGWEMLTASVRYKITGKYTIETGKMGPTEARIAIALILLTETFVFGSIHYLILIAFIILVINNILGFRQLLNYADKADKML